MTTETAKDDQQPLVSIGIPTYNRADSLARAIASALNQSYRSIEVIVSDNASNDDTELVCRQAMQRDPRLRFQRVQQNQGPISNFREVLRLASGEYFMWLSDDDWLDADYVAECLSRLRASPDTSLVGGRPQYIRNGRPVDVGSTVRVCAVRPWQRVFSYYMQVADNGIFYGLTRTSQLRKVPLRREIAGDWLLVGGLAYQGNIETLNEVTVHRALGGASASYAKICRTLGLPRRHAFVPELTVALNVARDVMVRGDVFAACRKTERMFWGSLLFVAVCGRLLALTLWRRLIKSFHALWCHLRRVEP